MKLLELTETGDGVRIFIGSESNLFSLSGSSVIVALVPMVDYTAKLISRILR